MRLIYLKQSLEISRENGAGDRLTLWNIIGANHYAFPDNTTISLETVKSIKILGIEKAGEDKLRI